MQVQTSAQNPVFGSVPEANPTPGVLRLTFKDAIDRALRQNLAGLLSEYNTIEARGEKWQQLSDLLPKVNADVQEVAEKESLEALGLRSGGPFGNVPAVIGPFSYFDVRASATQRLFDWKAIQKYRSSVVGERVAGFNLKDARDLVVLATGNAYLVAIAGIARVETAQAQVDTAKALYDKAVIQQQAGVAPAIDTLRAQVEYQTRQQQLITANNDLAKEKISLARVIGLAPASSSNWLRRFLTCLFPSLIWRRPYSARILFAPITKPRTIVWSRLNWNAARRRPGIIRRSMSPRISARLALFQSDVLPTYSSRAH